MHLAPTASPVATAASSATAIIPPLPTSLALSFNPAGVLPGRGPRELVVGLELDRAGVPRLTHARLGASFQSSLPVPTRRWRVGDELPTGSRLAGALDALQAVLPDLLPALASTPSEENDVDNGFGWAHGGTFALHTGPAGIVGTSYYYGRLAGDARPAVHRAVALLGDLAAALRAHR